MRKSIFPAVQPALKTKAQALPLAREVKWDFEKDEPILKHGQPVPVEGLEAVKVWAWNALFTVRYRHMIYPWSYGNEVETLIGQSYIEETKKAEAIRYVRECLMASAYITAVNNIRVHFTENHLQINCEIDTVYGRTVI